MERPKGQEPTQDASEPSRHEALIPRLPSFTLEKARMLPFLERAGEELGVAVVILAGPGQIYKTGSTSRKVPRNRVYLSIETSIDYEVNHRGLHDFYEEAEKLRRAARKKAK